VTVDNYDLNIRNDVPTDHHSMLKTVQQEFRKLEKYLKQINNREMDLSIVNLQQAAHWAFHSIVRDQSEKMEEKKDG
jgi:hypothetical protein